MLADVREAAAERLEDEAAIECQRAIGGIGHALGEREQDRPEHRVEGDGLGTIGAVGARHDVEPANAVLRHPWFLRVGTVRAVVLPVLDVGLHHHRDPRVGRCFEPHTREIRRRDADDREVHAVEGDVLADDVRRVIETTAPEGVTDHRDRMCAQRAVVVGRQQSSELRFQLQHAKPLAADELYVRALRRAIRVGQPHPRNAAHGSETVACGEAGTQLLEQRVGLTLRDRQPRLVARHVDVLRLRNRHRLQQHGVGDREDGAVGADARGEREHDDEGEAGIRAQHPRAVTDVFGDGVERRSGALFAHALRDRVFAPELDGGGATRLFERQAGFQFFVNEDVEHRAHFAIEIAIDAVTVAEIPPDAPYARQHGCSYRIPIRAGVSSRSYRMSIEEEASSRSRASSIAR